ncbi:hypothetical protein K491DRAFT_675028 [Lophiostoma macrostomum CBS 122681]|uniref:BTB domain-containing protein n=1 Tax=Lophiostoma macrostomum CBS 122681 TaxID=1314788 RepID=A0A6A6TIY1_9PLEO|nr:hypothetical protein K491DRAFT_675028 [Lophiostoma macrostomum CBS 122681]
MAPRATRSNTVLPRSVTRFTTIIPPGANFSSNTKRPHSAVDNRKSSTKDTPAPPPRKKLCRSEHEGPSLNSQSITILAGYIAQPFYIAEDMLRSSSIFFKIALKQEWLEGTERTIKLPTIKPTVVQIYLKWLYSGAFYFPTHPFWRTWQACYSFGDYVQDTGFKDACIDALTERMVEKKGKVSYDLAHTVYPLTIEGSPHRRFVLDWALYFQDLTRFKGMNAPEEFLEDMLVSMRPDVKWTVKEFFRDAGCKYHEHKQSGEKCYEEKAVCKF